MERLRRTSELHDTCRKADLVTAQMERLPLAVPLLVGLPDRQRDEGVEADPFSELRTECRVRGQEGLHLLEAGTGEARKPLGAIHGSAVRGERAQQQADRLGRVHAQHLDAIAFEGDVVAEPAGLFRRVSMTMGVHQHADVVSRFALPSVGTEAIG